METLKSNPRITYRVATGHDVVDLLGHLSPYTMKALAFFLDGKIVGLAGYKLEAGRYIIFSDFTATDQIPAQSVYRCAKIVIQFCKSLDVPMFIVGGNYPLFDKLGLNKIEEGVYVCHH